MIADAFQSRLDEYIDGVMSGEIVTGMLVRKAVERHVNDLKRQSTAEFPYHFDGKRAAKACNFYPRLLRHSAARFANLPFELEPWQLFIEGMLYGWLRDADDTRRFRTSFETQGRKNGKSTKMAGRALFMAGYDHNPVLGAKLGKVHVPEPVSQVFLCAAKRDQADKVIYAEIERMRRASASIRTASSDTRRQIRFHHNDGLVATLANDKPFDGLNPHFVAIDEIHAWKEHHRNFHDTMITGEGARDQPLISYITTAGNDQSHLWIETYDYARAVVEGVVEDESYFAFIAELDKDADPLDESNWAQANPNVGVSLSRDYLKRMSKRTTTPIGLNRFLRFHMNTRVSSIESAFNLATWDACRAELSDWSTAEVIKAGVDLGGRDDLSAYALVARWPTGYDDENNQLYRYEVLTQAYLSENTKRDLNTQPFANFIHSGKIELCRHPTSKLKEDLTQACREHCITEVAYDGTGAQHLAEQLEIEGITPATVAQNYRWFDEPIGTLLEAVENQQLAHDGDPVLRWAANNAVIKTNSQLQKMFDKASSADKIDPIVALTMAFRLCSMAKPRPTGALYI